MRIRTVVAALSLALLGWVSLLGQQPTSSRIMPLSEIRPGMVGIGRTVFEGTDLKEFKVHIIGVLRNIQGPKRDLILARLEGGPLADTGVAAGMSGSPVHRRALDRGGRLLDRVLSQRSHRGHYPDRGDEGSGARRCATHRAAGASSCRSPTKD